MSKEATRTTADKKRTTAGDTSASSTKPLPPHPAEPSRRWTFLTNHAHVLGVLHSAPDLTLREVATRVGITERAVQRITQDLEDEGYIRREKVGRQNHYHVNTSRPLRHPIEAHRKIGDLLALVTERGQER